MPAARPRVTLAQPAHLAGPGLHSGSTVRVSIHPAPAGHSLVFVRTDLPGTPRIRVQDIDRNAPPFRTALKAGAAGVHTVEHLLSALAGLGVTDARIELDGPEVPGMDGSARDFVRALQAAGLEPLDATLEPLAVTQELTVTDGPARITVRPPREPGTLHCTYTLHYPDHHFAQGTYCALLSPELYIREIAPARTFAIRPEAEKMRAAGFGKGATFENTLIIEGDKPLQTVPRFPDEPVRHKLLDLLGDLYVLGVPLAAEIEATYSGHRTNRLLALALAEQYCIPGF